MPDYIDASNNPHGLGDIADRKLTLVARVSDDTDIVPVPSVLPLEPAPTRDIPWPWIMAVIAIAWLITYKDTQL